MRIDFVKRLPCVKEVFRVDTEQAPSILKRPVSTRTRAIYLAWVLAGLLICGSVFDRFSFIGVRISDCWPLTYIALLISFYVIAFIGPAGPTRVSSLCLLVLVTLVSPALMFGVLLARPIPDTMQTMNVGFYKVKLLRSYDASCRDIYGNNIALVLERPLAAGIWTESKTLVFVQPALSATVQIIDRGKTIKFTASAVEERKEITRTFSTDWNDATNQTTETIHVEPDYSETGRLMPNIAK